MFIWEQVIQEELQPKSVLTLAGKSVCILSVAWAILFYILLYLGFSLTKLSWVVNGIQLFSGLVISAIILCYARFSQERKLSMDIAFGMVSWTIGQFYWISYSYLGGSLLPQSSIADFSYIGAYCFLIGVITTITRRIPPYTIKLSLRNLYPFAILVVPFFLALGGSNGMVDNIVNGILTLAIVCLLWKAQPLFAYSRYRVFCAGICLLCLSDILFIIGACLFPESYLIPADALFPLALSSIAYGFMKVEGGADE